MTERLDSFYVLTEKIDKLCINTLSIVLSHQIFTPILHCQLIHSASMAWYFFKEFDL